MIVDINFSISNSFKKEIKMKIISFARKKKEKGPIFGIGNAMGPARSIGPITSKLGQYLFLSSLILGLRNDSASP